MLRPFPSCGGKGRGGLLTGERRGDEPGGEYQGDEPGRALPRELHVRGGHPGRRPHWRRRRAASPAFEGPPAPRPGPASPRPGEPRVRGATCSPTMAPQAPAGRVPLREGSPRRGRGRGPVTGSPRRRCGIRSEPRWRSELSASHQSGPFYRPQHPRPDPHRRLEPPFCYRYGGERMTPPRSGSNCENPMEVPVLVLLRRGHRPRTPRRHHMPRGSPTTAEQKRLCRPTASRPSVPMSLVDHRHSLSPSVYTGPRSGQ